MTAEGGKHNGYLWVPSKKVGQSSNCFRTPDAHQGEPALSFGAVPRRFAWMLQAEPPTLRHPPFTTWITWGWYQPYLGSVGVCCLRAGACNSSRFFSRSLESVFSFSSSSGLEDLRRCQKHRMFSIVFYCSLLFEHLLIHINQPHWLPLCSSTRLL